MIQIESTIHRNLDQQALSHFNDVKDSIEKKIKSNPIGNWLRNFLTTNLQDIITGKPKQLIKLHRALNRLAKANLRKNPAVVNKRVSGIFDYGWLGNSKKRSYSFASRLAITTCPYCNRNYTVTIIDDNKNGVVRPDFDHFFPKSQYPLLALSFYNLVPSCPLCNRSVKGAKKTVYGKHIHPYEASYGSHFKINYNALDTDSLIGLGKNIEVVPSIDFSDKKMARQCENSFKLFKLKDIYQTSHQQEIADIIRKHHISNGLYLAKLAKQFRGFVSVEELYRIAFGAYMSEGDFINRPLSKMTKDIVDQLKFTIPLVKVNKP